LASWLELHRAGKPLPKFPRAAGIRAKTTFSSKPVSSENVIGVLPGSDPKLSAEYVVLTAHLDHLGTARPVDRDGVFNGAMDNASGVATLIEVAKSLTLSNPKRSVLFAAVTAEEGGLMGSKYFAGHPTVPAKSIVANLNFDMFLPIIPLKALTVYGIDESDLGTAFSAVAKRFGVRAERDPEPARNAFIRSDQYSFIRLGIPALTFKFHADRGTPEEKIMRAWRKERYHGIKDDLTQPVYPEDAVRFNKIMAVFVQQVASSPRRPLWKPYSFFRRYAGQKPAII
jgi:Zn-dependent M28 family amino/carboxypeptidase